jgi:hypothetical protein
MVYKNSKNTKKKINDLKPVIKTSFKKVNRKQTKKIGGSIIDWVKGKVSTGARKISKVPGKASEQIIRKVGRFQGKAVKLDTGKFKFFKRSERGLSSYPVGFNYRSGKQIENRMNYMTHRINEKKQIYTMVNGKLAGRRSKFRSIVNNKMEKLEIEMAEKTATLKGQLTKGKITQAEFDTKIADIAKKKDKTLAEIEKVKQNFLNRNKDLIQKVEAKKKDLIKISDKYKPDIEKLNLKLRTKVRKANKLLDTGLRRTCKGLKEQEKCFEILEKCRENPLIIGKAKISKCMFDQGFTDPLFAKNLDANILRTKWYNNPSRRRKIRARAARIDRLAETKLIQNKVHQALIDTKKLKDLKEAQKYVKPLKTSKIYSEESRYLEKDALQQIKQQEIENTVQIGKTKLTKELSNEVEKGELKFINRQNALEAKIRKEKEDAEKIITEATEATEKQKAIIAQQEPIYEKIDQSVLDRKKTLRRPEAPRPPELSGLPPPPPPPRRPQPDYEVPQNPQYVVPSKEQPQEIVYGQLSSVGTQPQISTSKV